MSAAPQGDVELLCNVGLGDAQVRHHLEPVVRVPCVRRVWLVRHAPLGAPMPKVVHVPAPVRKPRRFLSMHRRCRQLVARPAVRAVISFNPIPYGLIAAYAARERDLPVHFGFIGSDWYRDRWLVRQLVPVIARGARVTATGEGMRREMIDAGLAPAQVEILPHSVDTERFAPAADTGADYDAIFVGNLVPVKQVDVLLDGWAQVTRRRPHARLCVVGDGPERARLERHAADAGLGGAVDFVGHQADVVPWLRRARLFVMASASEGLPFALIEAMCVGLVPVVTDVGTIGEVVASGVNGALYRPGDAAALAQHVLSYLDAPHRLSAARDEALGLRATCSHDAVSARWAAWLDEVAPG